MDDDQVRSLLRILEDDREPDPAFAEALHTRLSLVARTSARSRVPLLLVAAALLSLLAASLAVGSGLLRLPLVVEPAPSASVEPSGVAVTASPTPDASATSGASPSVEPGELAGSILAATADGLRLRAQPGEGGELVATLRAGQRMGATGAREVVEGVAWVEVRIGPGDLAGWVASGPDSEWLRLVADGALVYRCQDCGANSVVSITPFGDDAIDTIAGQELEEWSWAPDGSRIAATVVGASEPTVVVMDPDGSNRRELGPGYTPAWSPDGARLAWATGTALVLTNENLVPTELEVGTRSVGGPHWSPDGSRIAFSSIDCPECPEDEPIVGDPPVATWIVDIDGSGLRQLTGGDYSVFADWSPDGTTLVFVEVDLSGEFPTRAYLLSVDGGDRRYLLDNGAVTASPRWSPDGDRLVLATPDGILLLDGDGDSPVTRGSAPETGIVEIGWSPSGRWIFYGTGGAGDGSGFDLWRIEPDAGESIRLTGEELASIQPAWQPVLVPLP